MKTQIIHTRFLEIDGDQGTDYVPFDDIYHAATKTCNPTKSDVKNYTENDEIYEISILDGYGARLTMPGFMDCTPWAVFETELEAKQYIEWIGGTD